MGTVVHLCRFPTTCRSGHWLAQPDTAVSVTPLPADPTQLPKYVRLHCWGYWCRYSQSGGHTPLGQRSQRSSFATGQTEIFSFLNLLHWHYRLLPCPLLERAREVTKSPQCTINCPAAASVFSVVYILPFYTLFFPFTSYQQKTNPQEEPKAETLHQNNIFKKSCTTHSPE